MAGRRSAAAFVLLVSASSVLSLANQDAFEAATVRVNASRTGSVEWRWQNGRLTATYVTLRMLISTAYGSPQQPLPDHQIVGGPGWINSERFDVVALESTDPPAAPAAGSSAGSLAQLRAFLEDRFRLKTQFVTREQPIYALVRARSDGTLGLGLRPRTADCAAVASGQAAGERCGGQVFPGTISARGVTMTQFVSGLARLMPNVGRSVVDKTGLTGMFDVDLTWTPDQMPAADAASTMPMPVPIPPVDPNGPSLFTALQEQLGLRLESTRGPVQVLLIDAVDRPKEN